MSFHTPADANDLTRMAVQLDARADDPGGGEQTATHSPWGWLILAGLILIVLIGVGWCIYGRFRARRLGQPPPSINPFADRNRISTRPYPARGGIIGWVQSKVRGLRSSNRRTAGGAYESSGGTGRAGRHGFGALDPDEAWSARVGDEADYEEQELGLQEPGMAHDGAYGGGGYGERTGRGYGSGRGLEEIHPDDASGRGRSRARSELDERYDEEMGAKPVEPHDPFGDHNAVPTGAGLRGVSPRPHEDRTAAPPAYSGTGDNRSPERKSVFRENM